MMMKNLIFSCPEKGGKRTNRDPWKHSPKQFSNLLNTTHQCSWQARIITSWRRMNTGLMTWENIYKKHKTRRSSFTSLNSSLLFSSSLLQRRNLKTKSKPAMRVVGSWRNISSKAVASPITKRLHRARRSAFLNSLERKVTTLPRKHFLDV